MTITVSTDGSALGNPDGPMGWAWADHGMNGPGHEHGGDSDAGGATNGTNQIGELCAVLEALRTHPGSEPLIIETDSQYAINCSTKWVHGWKKNGWKNSQKKPVKNAPLIKAIDAEISKRPGPVKFVWVKGHAGNAGNEKVDELARTYAGDCRSHVHDGYLPLEGWQSLLSSEYSEGTDIPGDAQLLLDGEISDREYHLARTGDEDATNFTSANGDSLDDDVIEIDDIDEFDDDFDDDDNLNESGESDESDELDNSDDNDFNAGFDDLEITEASENEASDEFEDVDDGEDVNEASAEETAVTDESDIASDNAEISEDEELDEVAADVDADDATRLTAIKSVSIDVADDEDESAVETTVTDDHSEASAPTTSQVIPKAEAPVVPATQPHKPRYQKSGLNVSGTLYFTPPPATSPTYNGQPRKVHGTIEIEGYVNGDGTFVVQNVPFYIKHS